MRGKYRGIIEGIDFIVGLKLIYGVVSPPAGPMNVLLV